MRPNRSAPVDLLLLDDRIAAVGRDIASRCPRERVGRADGGPRRVDADARSDRRAFPPARRRRLRGAAGAHDGHRTGRVDPQRHHHRRRRARLGLRRAQPAGPRDEGARAGDGRLHLLLLHRLVLPAARHADRLGAAGRDVHRAVRRREVRHLRDDGLGHGGRDGARRGGWRARREHRGQAADRPSPSRHEAKAASIPSSR